MKFLVVFVCAFAVASCHRHRHRRQSPVQELFNTIPECVAAKAAGGTAVQNCPNIGTCLDGAHSKAVECGNTLHADEKHKKCATENVDKFKDMIKYTCQWKHAVAECMKGDTPPGAEWPTTDTVTSAAHHFQFTDEQKQHMKCFHDVYDTLKQCIVTAESECPNFKACYGKEAADASAGENIVKWNKVSNALKHKRGEAAQAYWNAMKTCLTAA